MNDGIYSRYYCDLQPDPAEILRYAGEPKQREPGALMLACLAELGEIRGRLCWRRFALRREGQTMDLGFCRTDSESLARNLRGCSSLVLFAGTLGIEIDRFLAKYGRLSPAKALWFQAIGAAGIEALCDRFCEELPDLLPGSETRLRPRYSPGFGDFGLEYQPFIFAALDCQKTIGLTLTDSLLMSPTKSVTALIGIIDEETE
mgnify:CR=1 FL=1